MLHSVKNQGLEGLEASSDFKDIYNIIREVSKLPITVEVDYPTVTCSQDLYNKISSLSWNLSDLIVDLKVMLRDGYLVKLTGKTHDYLLEVLDSGVAINFSSVTGPVYRDVVYEGVDDYPYEFASPSLALVAKLFGFGVYLVPTTVAKKFQFVAVNADMQGDTFPSMLNTHMGFLDNSVVLYDPSVQRSEPLSTTAYESFLGADDSDFDLVLGEIYYEGDAISIKELLMHEGLYIVNKDNIDFSKATFLSKID